MSSFEFVVHSPEAGDQVQRTQGVLCSPLSAALKARFEMTIT